MDTVIETRQRPYAKFFSVLFMGLLVATLGLYVGQSVPRQLFLPLAIVEIILIFMMVLARKRKSIGYTMMFAFMFISGLTLYPAISIYVSTLGGLVVLRALGITALAFGGTAAYAIISKHDFRFLGGFLFVSIIALLGMTVLQIIFPISNTAQVVLSAFGILIFVGYTLYDFSRLTLEGFSDRDIPFLVVCIYLDIVNLFLYILQFLGVLNRD
ncbi:MAG: Bax inhibitor-1/YccA family protein [Tuberibacillus sp.]